MRRTSLLANLAILTSIGGSLALGSHPAAAQDPAPAETPPAEAAPAEAPPAEPVAAPAEEPAGEGPLEGLQFEGGIFGGVHLFAKDLELGVPDDFGNVSAPETVGAIFGLRLGLNFLPWVGIEGELGFTPTEDRVDKLNASILHYRGNVLVYLLHGKFRPFLLAGGGAMHLVSTKGSDLPVDRGLFYKDADLELHGGAGVKYDFTDNFGLRFDARVYSLPDTKNSSYSPDWEFTLGLAFKAGGRRPAPPAPPAPVDSDGDGIDDPMDKCPNEAEDKDGFQDEDGCPEPDNDGDGIADANDKCPLEPEDKNGVDEEDGCPEADEDKDGLVGSQDKCPAEPEDKDGFEDEDGCPDPDNDKDGVLDVNDKCVGEPETKNGFQDADGCPDELPPEVKKFTGVIQGINFKKNSADIQKSSFKILSGAVKVMKDYPDTRIEISGHTSSEGKREKNIELSKARADAVKAYLVSAGIDAGRIEAVGHGPDRPIALNKTRKGREQNRRIEFRLLTADAPAPQ